MNLVCIFFPGNEEENKVLKGTRIKSPDFLRNQRSWLETWTREGYIFLSDKKLNIGVKIFVP